MLLDLLRQRRSIRRFNTRKIETEKIDHLEEALLRCPTSRNLRPWEFILVDDPQLLCQLAAAKPHGSAFLAGAPLAIVVAADPQRCDVWVEDCSIAAIVAQLAAEELGLKSCWVQLRLRDHDERLAASAYVRELLSLPTGFEVPMVIGIGYPDEEMEGHPRAALPDEKLHRNRYGNR